MEAAYDRVSVKADTKPRCTRCAKVLAWLVTRPWRIQCSRCGLDNARG